MKPKSEHVSVEVFEHDGTPLLHLIRCRFEDLDNDVFEVWVAGDVGRLLGHVICWQYTPIRWVALPYWKKGISAREFSNRRDAIVYLYRDVIRKEWLREFRVYFHLRASHVPTARIY